MAVVTIAEFDEMQDPDLTKERAIIDKCPDFFDCTSIVYDNFSVNGYIVFIIYDESVL